MRLMYAAHIVAGSVALVSGYVALFAPKGARVHRRGGLVFAFAMLAMASLGATMAALQAGEGSVIAGVITCYLVITGLVAVRRPGWWSPRLDVALTLLALGVGLTSLALGFDTLWSPSGRRDGLPPFPFFMFGVVGLLAGAGDVRMLRAGGVRGARRLARHLWRMCWALWIAATSFFFGQAQVIPKPVRIMPLLAVPVLAVMVTMLYWLWRVRVRRSPRSVVRVAVPG